MDWGVFSEILVGTVLLYIGAKIAQRFEKKPKLFFYVSHTASFRVVGNPETGQEDSQVYTHSIIVKNTGTRAAENVRVCHAIFPINYQIIPATEHEIVVLEGASREIMIRSLVPGEMITIAYLYFHPTLVEDIHSGIKYSEGLAKEISVWQAQRFPNWVNYIILGLMFIGFTTVIYAIYELAIYLLARPK